MTTYSDHTSNRGEVSGRKPSGLKLSQPANRSERIQETLLRAGLIDVRVISLEDDQVKIYAPDYADYVLARSELRSLGLTAERV